MGIILKCPEPQGTIKLFHSKFELGNLKMYD